MAPSAANGSPRDRPTDAALIGMARGGDESAWPEIIERYHRPVFALLRSMTQDAVLTEELAHETFVTAWFDLKNLRDEQAFLGWLLGIARNRARAAIRRRRRVSLGLSESHLGAAGAVDPDVGQEASEEQRLADLAADVVELLVDLPAPYGEILRMRYIDGRICREIAEELGRPLNTVTKQLSRAHAMIAERIAARGGHTTTLAGWLPGPAEAGEGGGR